jgi:hypothetical protein
MASLDVEEWHIGEWFADRDGFGIGGDGRAGLV